MPTDVQPGDYTNGITGFEDGDNIFKNLTKLRQFYIANGEITFFYEILGRVPRRRNLQLPENDRIP